MKGWKTWAAAAIVALAAAVGYFGYPDIATAILTLGGAFGLVGLGHKLEKRR